MTIEVENAAGTTVALSPIQAFYANANVLVTGATGFLGRMLLEKLLRSCPQLSTIYVLVRNKKGKNLHTRVDELFEDVVFDRLRAEFPKFRHKIVAIGGDCSLPEMGLSLQDRQLLINEVNVIFHVAATVRFDEKLKVALAINVQSVQTLISLSREMHHLRSFMHVSTAYSNVPHAVIEEKFYPSPIDSRKLVVLCEALPDRIVDGITPTILDKWPNTYTFTKMVAEDVVRQEGHGLPLGVFRPAIVVSTYKEPIRAWINNLYGPTGVCAGAGTGVLRALHCDATVNANIVPVDMCVNALICAAWAVGDGFKDHPPAEPPIFHYESSTDRPINWGQFMDRSQRYGVRSPSVKAIWYYYLTLQRTRLGYLLAILFLHYLPAICVDGALFCLGRAPKMLNIYRRIHKFTDVISYFCTRTWRFESHHMNDVIGTMADVDKERFFCDLRKLDWDEFFQNYLLGIRLHLIKDPIDTMAEARAKWNRLYCLHQLVRAVVVFAVLRTLWWALASLLF